MLFPYSQRPSFMPMLKENKNCVSKYVIFQGISLRTNGETQT